MPMTGPAWRTLTIRKLGSGKEMVEKLTNLIAIFESKDLDFSKNRADGNDILGDACQSSSAVHKIVCAMHHH